MAQDFEFIGTGEAAIRLGLADAAVARRALRKGGVPLEKLSERAFAVRAADVAAFAEKRKATRTSKMGRSLAPLSEIECAVKVGGTLGACPGGDSLTGHHWSCPRGQAIIRRQKKGRDPKTGATLAQVPA